jgi:hypothetical protein
VRKVALLAAAGIIYLVAAWMVAPGFYDGFSPPQPYNFTCPPPQAGANQKPGSGHADIKVINGVSDANSAFTQDGQIVIGFLPGAFNAGGQTTITIDITPYPTCPQPPGIRFVTNIYHITASASLVKDSNLTMLYSNLEPDPSAIYHADDPNGPWTSIGAQSQSQPFTVWQKTRSFGYFAAGYASSSPAPAPTIGGGQTLPIIVAVLIVVVILAGLPVAVVRRRQKSGSAEEDDS